MRAQNFEKSEALGLVLLLLLNQLLDKFFELGLLRLGDEGLFQQDLVDQSVNVSPTRKQKVLVSIHFLCVCSRHYHTARSCAKFLFRMAALTSSAPNLDH